MVLYYGDHYVCIVPMRLPSEDDEAPEDVLMGLETHTEPYEIVHREDFPMRWQVEALSRFLLTDT